jgi:hypothetical protein
MKATRGALVAAALGTILATAVPAAPPPAAHEIENVSAFARLYGVVRYFHPGDAGAALDWNRFAVHGVSQMRTAGGREALRAALERLFGPLGPGIEVGEVLPAPSASAADATAGPLVAWRYLGPGFPDNALPGPYRGKRTNRAASDGIDGFVTVMQLSRAQPFRGKSIRLRGQVRAVAARVYGPAGVQGSAALWLRVDREGKKAGFFDNMSDRPVRDAAWRRYEIEGTVADDAVGIAFGVMASGAVTADFDAIELAVRGADGAWTEVPVPDAGFEAAPDGTRRDWFRAGTSKESSRVQAARRPRGASSCALRRRRTAARSSFQKGRRWPGATSTSTSGRA